MREREQGQERQKERRNDDSQKITEGQLVLSTWDSACQRFEPIKAAGSQYGTRNGGQGGILPGSTGREKGKEGGGEAT